MRIKGLSIKAFRPYHYMWMPYVILKSCTKCNACLTECPTGSIIEGKEQYLIDADTCADHAACVSVCPVNAIIKQDSRRQNIDEEEEEA